MATFTVGQTGGPTYDYSTLDAAFGGASVTDIEIQGTWSVDDSAFVAADVAVSVTCDTDSHNPGYISTTCYRLKTTANGTSASVTVTADCTFDGIAVENQRTDTSDECFRIDANNVDLVVKNVVGGFATAESDEQDFVYINNRDDCTVLLEQCHVYNVERAGVDVYSTTAKTNTVTINSCHFYNFGDGHRSGSERGGIVGSGLNSSATVNFTFRNSLFHFDADADYVCNLNTENGTHLIDQCITSEDDWDCHFITATVTDSAVSHTWALDDSNGTGNYVIIEGVKDLRIRDFGNTYNEAQDRHSVLTDESVTIPTLDIVGTTRVSGGSPAQGTGYDLGAFEISAGGADLTLTAATGAYTYTGTAASLEIARNLTATTGAYTYSGTAAELTSKTILTLSADTGAYTYTGAAAEFSPTRTIPATTGAYTYTGTAADLTYDVGATDLTLPADTGAYTYSGTAAELIHKNAISISADTGAYTYSGTAAAFSPTRNLSADTGAYTYTGTAATLSTATFLTLTADTGSYSYSGTAAEFSPTRSIAADTGAYTYSGTAADLTNTVIVDGDSGAYTYTGSDAALTHQVITGLTADTGSYAYTGTAADLNLTTGNTLQAETGAYTYSGTAAEFSVTRTLAADAGAYTYTGTAVDLDLVSGDILSADTGSYTYSGTAAAFIITRTLSAATGSYTYLGTAADLDYQTGNILSADSGSYSYLGTAATLTKAEAYLLEAGSGAYGYTGTAVDLASTTPEIINPWRWAADMVDSGYSTTNALRRVGSWYDSQRYRHRG